MKHFISRFLVMASFTVGSACRSNNQAALSDHATIDKVKTGMFLPELENELHRESNQAIDASALALELGISLSAQQAKFDAVKWRGEKILFVNRGDGSLPEPVSSAVGNTIYDWSTIALTDGKTAITSNVFIKYPRGTGRVSRTPETMYVMRRGVSQTGVREPFLVPWLAHVGSETSDLEVWRFGTTIFDSRNGLPILKFIPVGPQIWRVAGPYRDGDIEHGTIIWTQDDQKFYSKAPNHSKIVEWQKQDADSMDRVKEHDEQGFAVPKPVRAALAAASTTANDKPESIGFDLVTAADSAIRVRGNPAIEAESDVVFCLGNGDQPSGYSNIQSLGTHQRVESVTTGIWPFSSTTDRSVNTEYFYAERAEGNNRTRKVIYRDSNGQWQEQSATTFAAQIQTMQRNASQEAQAQLRTESMTAAREAEARRQRVDADAEAFVDRGFVGHMMDVTLATAGQAGSNGVKQVVHDKVAQDAMDITISAGQQVGGLMTNAVTGNLTRENATPALIQSGAGVVTTVLNSRVPLLGTVSEGAVRIGSESATGDTDGAKREVAIQTISVVGDIATSLPVDPITGAGIRATAEGTKKIAEGTIYISQLNDVGNKFQESNRMGNEVLQMSHDRRFADEAAARLNAAGFK